MQSNHADMDVPQPMIPALKPLASLKGQTSLVTGASSGIGRAIAVALGRAGANVIVNYVANPRDAEAVAEEIRGGGQRAMTIQADVTDETQVQAMFASAVLEFGTVDIAPGAIRTSINAAAWSTTEAYAGLMKLVPYKRIGEPEEIGRAAVWLASDFSDYIVGTTLVIDGGMTLYPGFESGG